MLGDVASWLSLPPVRDGGGTTYLLPLLPPAPPLLTAEEALRRAEVEGVTLLRSDISSSGYQGVSCRSGGSKPYQAIVRRGGKHVHLGYFVTAEAAALTFARSSAAHAAS